MRKGYQERMEKKAGSRRISVFLIDMRQKMTARFFIASFVTAFGIYLGVTGYGMDSCFDLLIDSMPAMSDFAFFDLVVSAFIAAGSFCGDYQCGIFQEKLIREGTNCYIFSQSISCAFSAGLVSVLARVWFVGILLLTGHPFSLSEFEMKNNLSPDIFYYDRCMEQGNIAGAFLIVAFSVFLFTGVCALAGLAFSAWFPNVYVAWFSPYIFLLMYKVLLYRMKQEYRLDFIGQAGSVSGSAVFGKRDGD